MREVFRISSLTLSIWFLATQLAVADTNEDSNQESGNTPTAEESIEQITTLEKVKIVADEVMTKISQDKATSALAAIAPYFPAPEEARNALATQVQQARGMLAQRFGRSLGYELVKTEQAGDVVVRYTYLEKRPRNITRWMLTFYKPAEHWIFHTLAWDESLQGLFE